MRLGCKLFAVSATLLVLAGCGSKTAAIPQADGPVVEITIERGSVTPVNATMSATVGQPITLRVTSDAADELHVHATPERSFAVEPKAEQAFQFTAEVPGNVDVELHHLDRTVATIRVQP